MNLDAKYPEVKVKLTGTDGNAMVVIGKVTGALRRAGAPQYDLAAFAEEAMSGDYDNVLQTAMRWVDVS